MLVGAVVALVMVVASHWLVCHLLTDSSILVFKILFALCDLQWRWKWWSW